MQDMTFIAYLLRSRPYKVNEILSQVHRIMDLGGNYMDIFLEVFLLNSDYQLNMQKFGMGKISPTWVLCILDQLFLMKDALRTVLKTFYQLIFIYPYIIWKIRDTY